MSSSKSSELSRQYDHMLLFRHISRYIARMSSAGCKFTMVGSEASGTDINESDWDMMIEPRNIIIEESSIIYREDLPCYVRIPTDELRGIVPRELVGNGQYMRADPVRDMNEEIFGKLNLIVNGFSKVGKIQTGSETSIDFVPQLKISGLPRTAHSFTTRDRSWPSDDIMSLIIKGEFHLAARPAPSNPDHEHDFCLSFAKAEVVLTRTMSVNQIISISLLKIIGCLVDGERVVLTSYILKTVALWFFEQTDNRVWENNRPVVSMLIKLYKYLEKKCLPHYFVHDMNLLCDVSESVLAHVKMRLRSFLGYHLMLEDITGISSYTKLILAVHIMGNANPTCHLFAGNGWFQYVQTGNVPDLNFKQKLSTKVITFCPAHIMIRGHMDRIQEWRLSLNELADEWLKSHRIESSICGNVNMYVTNIVGSTTESLDLSFGMNSEENVHGSRSVGGGSTHSEDTLKKWLTFSAVIINKLNSHGNNIASQVLDGMSHRSRDDSCWSSDVFMADACKLLDQVTKEIIEFAIDNIETGHIGLHPLRQAAVGDSPENIYMLYDAMELLFLPIEYDIVRRIRLNAPPTQLFTPIPLEYRCLGAFFIAQRMLRIFEHFQQAVHGYNCYLRFMANAIRGEHRT